MADAIANITAFLVSTLQAVQGIGLVHPYEPFATPAGDIPATMGASGAVHYWTVLCTGESAEWDTNITTVSQPIFTITGYIEVGNPAVSEPLVQALIQRVLTALRAFYQIPPSTGADTRETRPPQWVSKDQVVLAFTNFVVHHIVITLNPVVKTAP